MQSTLSSIYLPLPQPKRPAPPLSPEATAAIADLRETWHRLHDLDRGLAARAIVKLGVSRRRLALEFGFNEGTIRRVLKTLEASPADQERARQHQISTNELIRRVNGRGKTSAKETPARPESQPFHPARQLRIGPALDVLPLLKRKKPSSSNGSVEIPLAAIKILEKWKYRTGEY